MSFLADRYNQLKQDLQTKDIFSSFTIADYYFMKSLIFARNTLAQDEYNLYAQIFHIIYQALQKPDLYVYLHTEPSQLIENIRKRGRDFETEISEDYLAGIQKGYFEFFKQQPDLRIVVVDMSQTDFVSSDSDYHTLVSLIFSQTYKPGINRVSCKG